MAAAVLALVTTLTYSIVSGVASVWKLQKARSSTFDKARVGLDVLSQRLSQATLNTYWDYDNPGKPTRYIRQSELHFVMGEGSGDLGVDQAVTDAIFFVAPLGFTINTTNQPLFKMLTACGFYVRFSEDPSRPAFLDATRFPPRWRFRLFQFLQPGEQLSIYANTNGNAWFSSYVASNSYPLAENVIGLIMRAKYPTSSGTAEAYSYNSRTNASSPQYNQLPPSVAVTMAVIDEDSARMLAEQNGGSPPPVLPPSGAFTDPAKYREDLAAWEAALGNLRPPVSYRIFTADVPIRGAKWSQN